MIFCLSGRGSTLSVDMFPPIQLDDGLNWEVGLINFMTYNNISNVEDGKNNLLYFGERGERVVRLATGAYEVADLHMAIKHQMYKLMCDTDEYGPADSFAESDAHMETDKPNTSSTSHQKQTAAAAKKGNKKLHQVGAAKMDTPQDVYAPGGTHHHQSALVAGGAEQACRPPHFSLRTDKTTMKSWLFCSENIHFDKPNTVRRLLGFEPKMLEANKWHASDHPININGVNVVRITCNLARGSYTNGVEDHVLHEFFPQVGLGFKIVEIPNTVIYLPVNTKRIDTVVVRLTDQNGDPVSFQKETLSLRLHLRGVHSEAL